ncbi:MAG: MBL fold metallo-hydrolase, partial [Candidatus Marinimicrobia bacterium]|nr:MBL fold metallo-hydrolase [Candidatus Neomarinimicrobiota bacterium]MBT6840746.1 MBL fold metallo-hydrolase [Candidatus Neomarinimicrobiota bacterium]
MIKKLLSTLLGLFLLIFAVFTVLMNYRPAVPQLDKYAYQMNSQQSEGSLTVQFIGNTNLLVSDGETSILTDGFFTR